MKTVQYECVLISAIRYETNNEKSNVQILCVNEKLQIKYTPTDLYL